MSATPRSPGPRVLVVEDDPIIRNNAAELLLEEGFDVMSTDNGEDGIALVKGRHPELMICDIALPGLDGYAVLKAVREYAPTAHLPFIFLTARTERADVRLGMNLGADDYLTKPFALSELLEAVRTRLRRADEVARRGQAAIEQTARASQSWAPGIAAPPGIVVIAEAMRELYGQVARVASTGISVLLLGETGAGKEIVARTVHQTSPRRNGPFIALNCAAFTESLLESELFGHERGAFTGAVQSRAGLLESAAGGTVFLDEVADLTPSFQTKLLRVIEERKVMRVGGRSSIDIDVRFVAATHRDIEAEVQRASFREDLYYRLNGVSFVVPPLRERRAEIAPLARVFLARACAEQNRVPQLLMSRDFTSALERYAWPGNVRQLKSEVERAVALCSSDTLRVDHLSAKVLDANARAPSSDPPDRRAQLAREMEDLERERISHALEKTGGNQTLAAELLGISRRTLVYRLTNYKLPRPRKKE